MIATIIRCRIQKFVLLALALLAGWSLQVHAQGDFDFDAAFKATNETAEASAVVEEGEVDVAEDVVVADDADTADDVMAAAEPVLPEELSQDERVRRQELKLLAEQDAANAVKAYQAGDFAQTIELYKAARQKYLQTGRAPEIVAQARRIDEAIRAVYMDWAEALAQEARKSVNSQQFDVAIDKLKTAMELDPARRSELQQRINNYLEMKNDVRFREAIAEGNVDVGKKEREYDVKVLISQGEVFFGNERYIDARDRFEEALTIDPFNVTANRYLRKVNEKMGESARERRRAVREEKMAEVKWKWNDPIRPIRAERRGVIGGDEVPKVGESRIQEKLRSIVIPSISFEEATIHQVVQFLKEKSKELDPEGEGVNIFLHLRETGAGAQAPPAIAAPANDWGGFGDFSFDEGAARAAPAARPAAPAAAGGQGTITLAMESVTLGDAIKYICLGANLLYQVETGAVVISDTRITFQQMKTDFYSVKAGIFRSQKTREAAALTEWGATQEAGGGEAGGSMSPEDLRKYFENFGVEFPEKSSIAYDARTGKLIVHNTEQNLQKIRTVLREINITPTQVMIEAKFVEVNQEDLEGIGFQWAINQGYSNSSFSVKSQVSEPLIRRDIDTDEFTKLLNAGFDTNAALDIATRGFESIARPTSDLLNGNLSNAVRTIGSAFGGGGGNTGVLGLSMVLGSMEFSSLVHAIDQVKSSDILSAPKVTAVSGQTAIIRMVEERYFPESWTEPTIDSTSSGTGGSITSIIPSMPEFGEARDIGVILEVTPQVESDGYTIGLELRPQVIEFKGYDTSFNTTVETSLGTQVFKAQMPIIEARTVDTNVIVYDGETVVLGGMIREQIEEFDDKIPILGDLPLVGRLFKNRGSRSVKRNLLIFVTARLVDPAGQALRRQEALGLPDFRR